MNTPRTRWVAPWALLTLTASCGGSKAETQPPTPSEQELCEADESAIDWYYAPRSAWPFALTPWHDRLYFYARDDSAPTTARLYRYDTGTLRFIEPAPRLASDLMGPLTPWGKDVYAFRTSGLWRIGDDDSLTQVTDLDWGTLLAGFTGAWPRVHDDALYFQAASQGGDLELYRFDGTDAEVAADIPDEGLGGSYPTHLTTLGDALYFFASDRTNGRSLWAFDGENTALERDFAPVSSYPWSFDRILGTRDESLVLVTGYDGISANTLLLYTPGAEPLVIDTGVRSGGLVGATVVYTKLDGAYRYDGEERVPLGDMGGDFESGVELDGRLLALAAGDTLDSKVLFEVGTQSLERLLESTSIARVDEVVAFDSALFISASDVTTERFESPDQTSVGQELWRFDPSSGEVELAADIWPGWDFVCVRD